MSAVFAQPAMASERVIAHERGMRFMLVTLIAFLAISDVFDLPLSLGPGLSAKNALLYLLAAALAFKFAVQGFRVELPGIHVCFAVLIGYSLLSMLAAEWVIDYPRYDVFKSAINLKSRLIDQAIFFLVFFYSLRESRNALTMIKVLLLAVAGANLVAVLDAWGVLQIGELEARADGRMQGVMGESNQYAAFVTTFLPALAVAALTARGFWRLFWLAALLLSTAGMMMAVSRGAFVGIVVAGIWSAILFRRYVSLAKIAGIAAVGVAVMAVVLIVLSVQYGELLEQRVFGDSSKGDMVGASSGRTEIWSAAIARMTETPLTLFTGFGWDVYWSMPFRYSPHNHYLALWFNLGLIGVVCGTLLLVYAVRNGRQAVARAEPTYRPVLIAFVVGTLALAVATFFVDLYVPWLWYWAYAGLVLRIIVNERRAVSAAAVPAPSEPPQPIEHTSGTDQYGWIAPARKAH